jgi:hypothetical protein
MRDKNFDDNSSLLATPLWQPQIWYSSMGKLLYDMSKDSKIFESRIREPFTQRHNHQIQNTWILTNTSIRTSNLTLYTWMAKQIYNACSDLKIKYWQ